MFTITPVIESPLRASSSPWPVLDVQELSQVPLDPGSLECMGTFMAALCYGEEISTLAGLLSYIRDGFEGEPWAQGDIFAEGGFVFALNGVEIAPSCCGHLVNWRQWRELLETGKSPYFGHDPMGSAMRHADSIEIFKCGPDDPIISVPIAVFESELRSAEVKLRAFFDALPQWLESVGLGAESDILPILKWHFRIDDE